MKEFIKHPASWWAAVVVPALTIITVFNEYGFGSYIPYVTAIVCGGLTALAIWRRSVQIQKWDSEESLKG